MQARDNHDNNMSTITFCFCFQNNVGLVKNKTQKNTPKTSEVLLLTTKKIDKIGGQCQIMLAISFLRENTVKANFVGGRGDAEIQGGKRLGDETNASEQKGVMQWTGIKLKAKEGAPNPTPNLLSAVFHWKSSV